MMNINYATLIKIGGPKIFALNHFLAPEALYFNLKKDNDKKLHDSCLTFQKIGFILAIIHSGEIQGVFS